MMAISYKDVNEQIFKILTKLSNKLSFKKKTIIMTLQDPLINNSGNKEGRNLIRGFENKKK
ncbi:hypothetical protein DERP_000279 [Dermatophagoides pteronyssinus]|uniref:Uncharacterized protein n=1 Tax=Dermatophagoides pteronyssinus TaxID=6956 RepID=A0ABQ8IZR8_DERPT|nr:hypothetical protein DERP_000279 [Dermatophagoides pteronyssinus]